MMMQVMLQETILPEIDSAVKGRNSSGRSEKNEKSFADFLTSCRNNVGDSGKERPDEIKASLGQFQQKDLSSPAVQEEEDNSGDSLEGTGEGSNCALAAVPPELLQLPPVEPAVGIQLNPEILSLSASLVSTDAAIPPALPQEQQPQLSAGAVLLKETSVLVENEAVQMPAPAADLVYAPEHTGDSAATTSHPEVLPEVKDEGIEIPLEKGITLKGMDLPEEAVSAKGGPVAAAENAAKKESDSPAAAQSLNPKAQNEGTVSGGGQEAKAPEAPSISQNSTGESSQSYDFAGGSGEVSAGTTVSLPTDSVSSEDAFLSKLSQALKNQMISRSGLVAQNGRAEIRLELKPEYLGKLLLRLSLENGTLNAKFLVENHQVRSLIENSMSQLKQSLADQGIAWQEASVDVGDSGSGLFREDSDHGTRKWASGYHPSGEDPLELNQAVSGEDLLGRSISYLA